MADEPLPLESVAPPSPATTPVRLLDCVEELLLFTLSSQVDGSLGLDIGLSNDYCSRLLLSDPLHVHSNIGDDFRGVPMYPLYKSLARALERYLSSGTCLKVPDSDDESFKSKEGEWSKLLLENGSELMKIFKAVDFELHVQEPFFSQLRAGLKSAEGRCAIGDYNRIAPGASLLFNKTLVVEVQYVNQYSSFSEMLQVETLTKVLPGVKTIEEGVHIYRKFYTEEKERTNGVLAICVSKPASQPFVHMANLLTGLGYDGLNFLLGMKHTSGTVPDALPPPRSALVSSAMKPYRPNVKGSSLTHAARALAKHFGRSSDGWWGSFLGSDSDKNRLASDVINCLLSNCSWMNVHLIKPDECVFEIRVHEGYGARWSQDGLKFIGFLEPYVEEGHSKGWKH